MHDDWTKEDRAQRERLERNSSAGQRVNMASAINELAKAHDARAMPGLGSYAMIRLLQSDGATQAREARRHNRSHDAFMARVHPDSLLARAVAEWPDVAESEADDARDQPYATPIQASRVPEANGNMRADGRTVGDKWSGQVVEPITIEQMCVIAGVKALQSRYW